MTRLKKFIGLFLPALMLMTIMAGTAPAALLDFGPIVQEEVGSTPLNGGIKAGFPLWFRDSNRVPLQLCLEEVPGCLFAAVDRPDLGEPLAFPNIPDELFYYSATALIPNANAQLNDHLLFAGVEMNFADNGDGTYEQVGFSRVRIRIDSTVAGNYTVTTPWKQYLFTVDQATIDANAGRRVINATEDIGLRPDGEFAGVLLGNVGPYAYSQGAPFVTLTGSYLGDNTPRPLVGSPNNIFRIEGPAGFATVETNLFAVTGKIYNIDPIPTPLTVDKLTYARDAAGVQVSAFATTQAMSNQVNSGLAFPLNYALTNAPSTLQLTGEGLPAPLLTTNTPGDGKFFTNIGAFALANIPANATITNTADTPVTVKTVPLVDEIEITNATFNPLNNTLTVAAQSLDTLGNRTLSVYVPGNNTPLGTITSGQFSATAPFVAGATSYAIPPVAITVKSDLGGEATAPVVAFAEAQNLPTAAPTPIAPVGSSTATPVFTFNAVEDATAYTVYVFNVTTQTGTSNTVSSVAAGCPTVGGTCSISLGDPLVAGNNYTWIVSGQNTAGQGPWSAYTNLTVVTTSPTAPVAISTVGADIISTPIYVFNAVPEATDYLVYVFNNTTSTGADSGWTSAAAAGCSTGTGACRILQTTPLTPGNSYTWIVFARNAAGQSPQSGFINFTSIGLPSAPASISPTGTAATTPTYTFNAVSGATGYIVYVFDNDTSTGVATSVITPAAAGCPTGTGTCSIPQGTPLILGNNYTWIVSALNTAGQGPWSGYLSFVTQ